MMTRPSWISKRDVSKFFNRKLVKKTGFNMEKMQIRQNIEGKLWTIEISCKKTFFWEEYKPEPLFGSSFLKSVLGKFSQIENFIFAHPKFERLQNPTLGWFTYVVRTESRGFQTTWQTFKTYFSEKNCKFRISFLTTACT